MRTVSFLPKKKVLILIVLIVLSLALISYQVIFDVPEQPTLTVNGESQVACYEHSNTHYIDDNGELNILVWNIYKEQREALLPALTQLSSGKNLVLLQEASMTKPMQTWIDKGGWASNQVQAFKAFNTASGVLNLSKHLPSKACAYTAVEPWLRLPKSAIWAQYPLSSDQVLTVVNIHAINFTLETKEYQQQLKALARRIEKQVGPIIVAGDFNSWSEERMVVIKKAFLTLGLQEAQFKPDHRMRFMGQHPLDHVFYKGLTLKKAASPESDASDHNPLLVSFGLL